MKGAAKNGRPFFVSNSPTLQCDHGCLPVHLHIFSGVSLTFLYLCTYFLRRFYIDLAGGARSQSSKQKKSRPKAALVSCAVVITADRQLESLM